MRIGKIIPALLLIGVASIGARQLIQKRSIAKAPEISREDQGRGVKLKVVSSLPRTQTGKYGLSDVAVLDNGAFWGVGYDGKNVDRIYLSKDTGATLEPVEVPGNGFTMHAITFSDSQHGWAVGGNGLILHTKNGGSTWELLKPSIPNESGERQSDLHAVHFIDANVGYIAGNKRTASKTSDEVWGSVEILCTKDGGENWRRCYQKDEPLTAFQITSNAQSTFVVFGDRAIRTDDEGETWQEVSTSAKRIFSIAFSADGTGWLVGNRGVFQQSIDSGKTWQAPASLPAEFANRDWEAVAFNSRGIGLAVGENSTLALTTDNGKTWKLQTVIKADHLRAVRMQDSRVVILGAQNAYSLDISLANAQQARSK